MATGSAPAAPKPRMVAAAVAVLAALALPSARAGFQAGSGIMLTVPPMGSVGQITGRVWGLPGPMSNYRVRGAGVGRAWGGRGHGRLCQPNAVPHRAPLPPPAPPVFCRPLC